MKRIVPSSIVLNAITVATLSTSKLVEDLRHLVLDVISTGATGTIKVKVSNQNDEPDFSAASTPTNHWTYTDLISRNGGGGTITGTTGIVLSTTTANNSYAINTDAVRWVAVDAESLSAGSLSALISGATND